MKLINKTVQCWEDLEARMQSIATLEKKVFKAADAENLAAQLKALPPPAVGIVYEGSRGQSEVGHARRGIEMVGVFGIYLVVNNLKFAPGVDTKNLSINILKEIEDSVRASKAPTGHFWQFLVQSMVSNSKDHTVWVSRWQTVIFT